MSSVRVVVVDDHAVFRQGLRALIAAVPDMEVVGEAGEAEEALAVCRQTRPDVVLMDLHMPGGGVEATSALRCQLPRIAVLVLTMHSDDAFVRRALGAGARGYLLKDAGPDEILRAVRAVAAGQAIFDPGVAAGVLSAGAGEGSYPFPGLTPRERDVLDRLARGLDTEMIAARLGLSAKTVQNNVSSILAKLGARDRAHAVAMARDRGIAGS